MILFGRVLSLSKGFGALRIWDSAKTEGGLWSLFRRVSGESHLPRNDKEEGIASADFVSLATTQKRRVLRNDNGRLAKKSGDPRLTRGHRQV